MSVENFWRHPEAASRHSSRSFGHVRPPCRLTALNMHDRFFVRSDSWQTHQLKISLREL